MDEYFYIKINSEPTWSYSWTVRGHDLESFLEINLSETMFRSLKCKTAVRSINLIWAFFSVILRERFLVSSRRTWKKKLLTVFAAVLLFVLTFFFKFLSWYTTCYMYYNTTHSMQDLATWSDHKKSKETTLNHFIMLDGLKQIGQDSQCSHSVVKYVMD